MVTSSLVSTAPLHFGISRKPRTPKLKIFFGPQVILGCSALDSKPLPLLNDTYEPQEIPEGIEINEWPVFARAPKSVPLKTAGMVNCSALRIDGPGDEHYLMHLNPISDIPVIEKHLREDLPWDLTNPDVTIDVIPGINDPHDTIDNIVKALHNIDPKLPKKVRYRHFPESSDGWGDNRFKNNSRLTNPRAVVSYDGDVFCHQRYSEQPPFQPGGKPVSTKYKPKAKFA